MKVCLAFGSLLAIKSMQAQNTTLDKISIASPTAGSLGKYADIPVNYHTGIPNISIPIYTVKAGPVSLPISLSYHASGLKVQEPSGWVGAGWSLNAGGVITRSVKGGPDERGTNMGAQEEKGHFSDYGYNSYLAGGGQAQDWLSFAEGRKDGEPDLFFFNFAGRSGKFYFRDDRTPVLVPQQDLKIEYYYPGDTATAGTQSSWNIQAFTITTPEGEKYYFGNTPGLSGTAPVEITTTVTDNGGISGSAIVSSWYLNKITAADNQFSISFTYDAENYGYFTTGMFPLDGASTAYEYNLVKNIMSGVRLNQISFPGGTVTFNGGAARTDLSSGLNCVSDTTNSTAKTLGSIQISNGGTFCKKYAFSYGYFEDSTSALTGYFYNSGYNGTIYTDRYRLRLDTLREISCDATIQIPPHIFTYFSEPVPRLLSFGIDHWGYANGVSNNAKLIPTYTINDGSNVTSYPGANRESAWPAMRAGSLQKITYPTGGYSIFEFEPHDIYTSHSEYQPVSRLGMSMGFDGNATPVTSTLATDGNPMQLTINNTQGNYEARVVIKNGGIDVYNSGFVAAGTSYTTPLSLPAATYEVILTIATGGGSNPSGKGVAANFFQWVNMTVAGNTMVGGLRIKTITHNDGATVRDMTTSYEYQTADTKSTGILYSKPTYVQLLRNDLVRDIGYYSYTAGGFTPNTLGQNGCICVGCYYKSPATIRPMGSTQGNHLGYKEVKVSQPGNGYSIYGYYADNNGGTFITAMQNSDVAVKTITTMYCDANLPNYPAAPLPFDSKKGELNYEQHYNNAGQRVKDIYYYPVFSNAIDSAVQTPGFAVTALSYAGVTKLLGTFYKLGTIHKSSELIVTTEYSSGNSMVTTTRTEFNSPYHNQPTRRIVVNSTGDSLVSKLTYAFDFSISTCDSISTGAVSYPASCVSCLTTYNSARNSCGNTAGCLTAAYMAYTQCLTNARINWVALRRENFTNTSNVFSANHLIAKNNADGELKPILQLQDQYDNALIEKTDWKNNTLLSAGFTHYDFAANPSGFVYPQKAKTIELLVPSPSFIPAVTSGNNQSILADSRYSDLSSFAFINANLAHITKRDGITESYLWDYNNQYPVAKTDNATETQIAFTSFESDSKGNWTYNATGSRSDSGAITGKKAYILSAGALQRTSLESAKTYLLTYWLKDNGGTVSVGGTLLLAKNGWKLYGKEITGVTSLTISGTGLIDEVRLYPQNAQMTTYTYDPLVGMTSQCDLNNRITYYLYDTLGRLKVVKDMDGNIIKTLQYNYKK